MDAYPLMQSSPSSRSGRWISRLTLTALCLSGVFVGQAAFAQAPPAAPAGNQALPPLRTGSGATAADVAPALPAPAVPTPEVVPSPPQLPAPTAAAPPAGAPPEVAAPTPPAHGEAAPAHEPVAHDAQPTGAHDTATAPLPPFPGHEAGHEAAHGAAAHGGHGGGHHGEAGPVIENWVSWDYGPGKTHHNPPFLFALINFAVFAFILSRLFGKSFKTFLENRHGEVRHALDRARHVQQEAEEQLKSIESRIAGLEKEMNELLASYRKQAEAERQAIVKRAEEEAAGLLRDAEAQAQAAIATARRQLEEKAALMAVDLAEKLVRSRLRDDDHKRLTEQYVAQVEGLSHPKESV